MVKRKIKEGRGIDMLRGRGGGGEGVLRRSHLCRVFRGSEPCPWLGRRFTLRGCPCKDQRQEGDRHI